MEFVYTIDPAAQEPIMTILGEIGVDVKGDQFCKELLFLDTLGKSEIKVWIHSEGGQVMDAEKIIAAILKTKTKVNTYNIGLCASCAGPVFLAGRNRYMVDYGKLMMHPVSGGDQKSRQAFEDSVVTMLSSRSGLTEGVIRKMMNETTWLNAQQCKDLGLCEVEDCSDMNRPRKKAEEMNYADYLSIVNKQIDEVKNKTTDIPMKLITNKLNLNEAANEAQIISEIEKIENKAKTAEAKLVSQETENKVKVEDLTNKVTAAEKERDELKAKLTEIENKAKADKEAEAEKQSDERIKKAVQDGKIENKADVIAEYKALAKEKPEMFDKIVNAMPVNKAMPGKPAGQAKGLDGIKDVSELSVDSTNPMSYVTLRNALNQKKALDRYNPQN